MIKKCLFCKKVFKAIKAEHKRGRAKYCSRQCFFDYHKKGKFVKCKVCNKETYKRQTDLRQGFGNYCSHKCSNIDQRIGANKNCLTCGNSFYLEISRIRKNNCCSKKCRGIFERGENHWNWQGGIYEMYNEIRSSPLSKRWSIEVKERDNYECQICGINKKLQANHIKKFSDYPELRFDLNNGITLCEYCHKLVTNYELEWESYFTLNLKTRGFIEDEFLFKTI